MGVRLDHLIQLLSLERIEENLFRGQSEDLGWGQLYGGHVLGQALSAATQTVPADRFVHSAHAYFLRPGNVSRPTIYDVDRIRDGGSFTTRRVVGIQNGEAIFNLSVSFHKEEEGFEHQSAMVDVPAPETLPNEEERARTFAHKLAPPLSTRVLEERPFDIRLVDPSDPFTTDAREPKRALWLRANGQVGDEDAVHRQLLSYASDYSFVTTSLLPHGVSWLMPGLHIASIDHAIWFHRPFRIDDWLLHVMDSPTAHGARGLARGQVYTRDGRLVASTMQEGLIRRRTTKQP
jgi:acyl-CoA thioesterase-2